MRYIVTIAGALLISGVPTKAQAPDEPKIWTLTTSAGLALTQGNRDTSTVNASYDLVYDPPGRNIVKSDALLIRGKTEGELTGSRLGVNIRDEFKLRAPAACGKRIQATRFDRPAPSPPPKSCRRR